MCRKSLKSYTRNKEAGETLLFIYEKVFNLLTSRYNKGIHKLKRDGGMHHEVFSCRSWGVGGYIGARLAEKEMTLRFSSVRSGRNN